ncbi:Uncharacterized protein GBIM_20785 [Gryllus bimaculatus]|nr:Uncharacterized protein GBIM_20785 [Gryllus bimaculatus]
MLKLCVVLFCFLSTNVGASRLLRRAVEPAPSAVSPVLHSNNKALDNTTLSPNSTSNVEIAVSNGSLIVVVNNTGEPTETKTEEKPKSTENGPLNGLFSRTPTGAALRGLYVFVGLSAVVMLYIAVKLIRLRRKKMRIRKYGLIANADDVEMTPLGADDDDEDTTLFDAHNHIGR